MMSLALVVNCVEKLIKEGKVWTIIEMLLTKENALNADIVTKHILAINPSRNIWKSSTLISLWLTKFNGQLLGTILYINFPFLTIYQSQSPRGMYGDQEGLLCERSSQSPTFWGLNVTFHSILKKGPYNS